MKNHIVTIALFALMFLFTRCGEGDASTTDASTLKLLTSTGWKIESVMIDNTDQTSLFPDLVLNFAPDEYTVENGKLVWPSAGVWVFDENDESVICRDDEVNITIEEITENKLVLSLDWPEITFGKINSISGQYVFTFVKV